MLKPFLPLALTVAASAAFAGTAQVTKTGTKEQSALDKLWNYPVLHKNDKNPFIEEFALTGRFQLDYFNDDSDRGDNDFLEIRRFRLGIDSWWANRHVELKATVDTSLRTYNSPSIFYNRMTDLFLNFRVNDGLSIRVGKFEPHFGYDREFSDNLQKFFERSFFDGNVFNNTGNDYVTGASVSGRIGQWGYQAAIFSDNVGQEFGDFDGGQSYLGEISYDFSKRLDSEKALWALDYMHMENTTNSNVFNTMVNAVATYFDYQKARLGLVTQFGYGNAISSKGNIYEFMLMPTYYVIPQKLEVIARYQLGLASQRNGITKVDRQVNTLGTFTGDTYNSIYLGLNYYVYGQKLKIMLAEQYDNLTGGTGKKANYRGWTTLIGFRLFW